MSDTPIPRAAAPAGFFPRTASWLRAVHTRMRRPVANGTYSAEIDGLRFIAIAIVVVGHFMERAMRFFPVAHAEIEGHPVATLFLRPGYGVYLFFTISGFIITRQVIRAQAAPLSLKFLKAYFGRRVMRIEPPYIILLVATWLLIGLSGYRPDQTNHFATTPGSLTASLVGSVFYVHDLVWGTYPRLFPPGWSLEIEVQFYAAAPLLFWVFLNVRSLPGKIALGVSGLFGGALLSLVAPRHIGVLHTDASIFLFFHFFWLGILLAHMRDWIVLKAAHLPLASAGVLGWVGLICYVVMPDAPGDHIALAMVIRAATLASLLAMFVSAFVKGSSFRRFCERPWISLIGGACYSIYLTHLQVIQAMTSGVAKLAPHGGLGVVVVFLVVETAAVVGIGLAFYVLIERPFMIRDWPDRVAVQVQALLGRLRSGASSYPQTAPRKLESSREPN